MIFFVIISIFITFFFVKNYEKMRLKSRVNEIISFISKSSSGEYKYKKGVLYDNTGNIIKSDVFIEGNGIIIKDIYNNIKLYIETNKYCANKTSLNDLEVVKGKCNSFNNIEVTYIKNNTEVSFSVNKKNLEYKISNKNDFKGEWKKTDYDENLIINFYEKGDKYIWFKDEEGNISEVINFSIDCFYSDKSIYDSKTYYCIGSNVTINDIEWIVISDSEKKIDLLKLSPINEKLSHCFDEESNYCYYKDNNNFKEYKWSNSYINYYLNNIYIKELDYLSDKLDRIDICNSPSGTKGCDSDDGCGGYTKETIEKNKWSCSEYATSRVRLLSYYEYNSLYASIENKNYIIGNYWTMATSVSGKGCSIQYNGDFFVLENLKNKLDIRPVITLTK